MNTLLPFASFNSIGLLSNADLGVQIYEARELIHLLEDCPAGYYKNPAAMQWYGYFNTLRDYYNNCLINWVNRGFTSDCKRLETDLHLASRIPAWFGDERVHSFHRATLLKRNPSFYSRYAWKDRLDVPAIYPDMHRYGAQMREHIKTDYAPPVEFNWGRFMGRFHV